MVVCLIIFATRFGPDWISLPARPTGTAPQIAVLSWNTYVDNRQPLSIPTTLRTSPATVVALQELTVAQSDAIRDDVELQRRYPWRMLVPGGADGMGLLSSHPILEQGRLNNPTLPDAFPALWARLNVGEGRSLLVVNAHPRPGRIGFRSDPPIPTDFDPTTRDAEIRYIHEFVALKLAQGERVLLMGDFNVTDREPAYRELVAGLQDAHAAVGIGPGHTWRHARIMHYGFALLRIDYLLASPDIRPLSATSDCTPRGGDHCIVQGVFELQ
jgi:endonuclease/exonuclease/phosphatase (EEP) superfamily protein YafD